MKSSSRSIRQSDLLSPDDLHLPVSERASQVHSGHSSTPALKARTSLQSLAESRLRRHADYQRAYAVSRKHQSASMSWFLARQSPAFAGAALASGPRVGLTVGKVVGKAHERNRIKRRMREALRKQLALFPDGFDLIFHPRRTVLTVDFAKLEAEIVRILHQANAEARQVKPEAHQAKASSASLSKPVPAL
jgi:ribonuclease P protein component